MSERYVGTNGTVSTPISSQTITSKKLVAETRWLKLSTVTYLDPTGSERSWDVAERTTRTSDCDGVDILAITEHKQNQDIKNKSIVLVLQYRPPLGSLSLEFPAGLVDAGENCETAAVRELLEETGYKGTLVSSSPILGLDAGMSSSNTRLVHVSIDMDDAENLNPKKHLEDGEFIETLLVPLDSLLESINKLCKDRAAVCDAKVYTFALARHFAAL